MFVYKNRYSILFKAIALAVVCLFLVDDVAFSISIPSSELNKSALAPPLATKPPCEIRYDEKMGTCDVVTNNDVIESWDKETVRSVRTNETLGKAFRNRWAFVDVGYLIGQMLILTQEHKLQNPKEILIPLIKKHIRNRDGEAEILLEGYDIDGIEEIREGQTITGFSMPVTRNGAPAYRLIYNLQGGDTDIQMKDGTKVWIKVEADEEKVVRVITSLASFGHGTNDSTKKDEEIRTMASALPSYLNIAGLLRLGVSVERIIYDPGQGPAYKESFKIRFKNSDNEEIEGEIILNVYREKDFRSSLGDSSRKPVKVLVTSMYPNLPPLHGLGKTLLWLLLCREAGWRGEHAVITNSWRSTRAMMKSMPELLVSEFGLNNIEFRIPVLGPEQSHAVAAIFEKYIKFIDNESGIKLANVEMQEDKDIGHTTVIAKTAISDSERIHTTNFQDTLTYIQAQPQAQPIIVALGTSWITGYEEGRYLQYGALNPLLSSMGKRPQFIVRDDKDLLAEIKKKMGEKGFENARVIVLAGEEAVTKELAELNNGKNILLGVDNKYLTVDSYVRVMEMLEVAAKLALDPNTPPNSPNIPIERRGNIWVFIPRAEPMDYEQLKVVYEVQKFA